MIRLAPLALLLACGPAKDSTGPTGGTTTTSGAATGTGTGTGAATGTGTGTGTGSTTPGWIPTKYRVAYGWFGVRDNQATVVDDVDLFGTPVQWPIQVAIRLGDDTVQTAPTPDNHCDAVYTSYATLDPASWTGDAGAWFAVEVPADAALSTSNCGDLGLDPSWSDLDDRIDAHRWGLVVRLLTQDDIDARGGYGTTGTDPQIGKLVGASWWSTAVSGSVGGGTSLEPGFATGNEIDANGLLLRQANRDFYPIDASAVPVTGGLTDGFYQMTGGSPWRDATEL